MNEQIQELKTIKKGMPKRTKPKPKPANEDLQKQINAMKTAVDSALVAHKEATAHLRNRVDQAEQRLNRLERVIKGVGV